MSFSSFRFPEESERGGSPSYVATFRGRGREKSGVLPAPVGRFPCGSVSGGVGDRPHGGLRGTTPARGLGQSPDIFTAWGARCLVFGGAGDHPRSHGAKRKAADKAVRK